MEKSGTFICIEGLDASGKTTQSKLLVKNLRKKGFDAVYTTEPSEGRIGRLIRRHVLLGENRLSAALEALLFSADRIDHLEREIMPALKDKKIVVSDRYLYSSIAYQGAAGLDLKWIEEVNKWALKPDLTLYIDIPPEIVLKRLKRKKSIMETLRTQERVRDVYLKIARANNVCMIDGNRLKAQIAKEILQTVTTFLSARGA